MDNTADWHLCLAKRRLDILEQCHIGLKHIEVAPQRGQSLSHLVGHVCTPRERSNVLGAHLLGQENGKTAAQPAEAADDQMTHIRSQLGRDVRGLTDRDDSTRIFCPFRLILFLLSYHITTRHVFSRHHKFAHVSTLSQQAESVGHAGVRKGLSGENRLNGSLLQQTNQIRHDDLDGRVREEARRRIQGAVRHVARKRLHGQRLAGEHVPFANLDKRPVGSEQVPRGLEQRPRQRVEHQVDARTVRQAADPLDKLGRARRKDVVRRHVQLVHQKLLLGVAADGGKDLDVADAPAQLDGRVAHAARRRVDQHAHAAAQAAEVEERVHGRDVDDAQRGGVLEAHGVGDGVHALRAGAHAVRERRAAEDDDALAGLECRHVRRHAHHDARRLFAEAVLVRRDQAHGHGDVLVVEARRVHLDLDVVGRQVGWKRRLGEAQRVDVAQALGAELHADRGVGCAGVEQVALVDVGTLEFGSVECGVWRDAADVQDALALGEFALGGSVAATGG